MTPSAASWSVSVTSQRTSRPLRRPVAAAAEQVAEDVAERREDVFDVVEVWPRVAVHARVAEAVVARALVGVVEHLERFGRFLESLDRLFVARVLVRVVLDGQLAIGVGNLPSVAVRATPSTS